MHLNKMSGSQIWEKKVVSGVWSLMLQCVLLLINEVKHANKNKIQAGTHFWVKFYSSSKLMRFLSVGQWSCEVWFSLHVYLVLCVCVYVYKSIYMHVYVKWSNTVGSVLLCDRAPEKDIRYLYTHNKYELD